MDGTMSFSKRDFLITIFLFALFYSEGVWGSTNKYPEIPNPPQPPASGENPFMAERKSMDTNPDVYLPTKCESCIVFARELEAAVSRLSLKMRGDDAEAWLIDELEGVCGRMLDYRLHREREGVARFSKEMPRIAKLAQDMVDRGVDLRLDVPTNLLNEPTVESDLLRRHCEFFIEDFEADIERWFLERRSDYSLERYLCGGKFAKRGDASCHDIVTRHRSQKEKANGADKTEL